MNMHERLEVELKYDKLCTKATTVQKSGNGSLFDMDQVAKSMENNQVIPKSGTLKNGASHKNNNASSSLSQTVGNSPVKQEYYSLSANIQICPPSKRRNGSSKSRKSSSNSSNFMCRICHEGDICEDLISPCDCIGTMAMVHASCLVLWLETSNKTECEICHKPYATERTPKSFKEWLFHNSTSIEHRHRVGDLICFSLLLPIAICSTYLCLNAAFTKAVWNNHWEAGGLIFLTTFFVSIFFVWTTVSIRYHIRAWKKWQKLNQNIKLIFPKQCDELNDDVFPRATSIVMPPSNADRSTWSSYSPPLHTVQEIHHF